MNWALVFLSLDVANIVCSAIFGARFVLARPKQPIAQLIALICFNSICHTILSRYDYRYWIPAAYHLDVGAVEPVLNLLRNLTPGLFMVLCFTMFADSRHFPRWLLGLFGLQMVLEVLRHAQLPFGQVITQALPALLQTIFVMAALYWTVVDWRSDLVDTRRRSRAIVVLIIGVNIIGQSLLLRAVIDPNTIANYHALVFFQALALPVTLSMILRLNDADLVELVEPGRAPVRPETPVPALSLETGAALARLKALMETEGLYRKASLSLRDLTALVGLPEYRVRKLIHEELGFPNFNAFLHHYRIGEACRQLSDPGKRRTPILTIALSTGYQSVNTFNRAFREVTGMTPSDYRTKAFGSPAAPSEKSSPETA